jgi:hypothetical protein
MTFSLRRWRPRHLLLAWCAYWLGLILVTLWPAILAGWRLSDEHGHGSASAGVADGVLSAKIIDSGQVLWTGSISLSALALLLALPPLALWLVWFIASSRTNNAGEMGPANRTKQGELLGSDRTPGMTKSFSQTSNRQRREES